MLYLLFISLHILIQLYLPVPNYVIRHSELEASEDGRVLIDFYYACVGYSVYKNVNAVSTDMLPNVNDVSTDKGVTRRQLPVCFGLEVKFFCLVICLYCVRLFMFLTIFLLPTYAV